MKNTIEEIHESLVNGNRQQMVRQIQEYGLYDFWADYKEYLNGLYVNDNAKFQYFTDAAIAYAHITNR